MRVKIGEPPQRHLFAAARLFAASRTARPQLDGSDVEMRLIRRVDDTQYGVEPFQRAVARSDWHIHEPQRFPAGASTGGAHDARQHEAIQIVLGRLYARRMSALRKIRAVLALHPQLDADAHLAA